MTSSSDTTLQEIYLTNGTRMLWGPTDAGQSIRLNPVARPWFVMHFTLVGSMLLHVEGLEQPVGVRANQHSILYPAGGAFRLDTGTGQPGQFLQIQVVPGFFGQPSADDGPVLHHLTELARTHQPAWLAPEHLPITPDMHTVVAQTLNSPLTCSLKRLFLEAKVRELLALQLAQYEQAATGSAGSAPGPDYDKVVKVRRLLETHFDNPPSLAELSRLVGLNEFKLKKTFKAAFGDTVYNWVLNYRLEQAYGLLQRRQLSISEVAYQVGYQHPAHFTTAFKKKFGVTPSHLILRVPN